jgi:hypothetical protein
MRGFATTLLLFGLLAAPRFASAEEANACGCYHDESGACKCVNKKAKCACPGDCEPVACTAKREKEASREADATLKKIQAREKKKSVEAARDAKSRSKLKKAKQEEPATKDAIDQVLQGQPPAQKSP